MAFDGIKKALFDGDNKQENVEDGFYTLTNKQLKEEEVKNGSKMILIEPRAYSESQQIADHLKNRNTVVVNLKRLTSDQAKRLIDFLTGTAYAIGGNLQRLGHGIYLCTPNNVNIQGKMSESEDKEKTKAKVDDELDF